MMLTALSTYHAGMPQVVVAGDPMSADARALARAAHRQYLPTALVIPVTPQHRERVAQLLPWIRAMPAKDGQATAYVCRDFACQMPATSAEELTAQLRPERLDGVP